jgi:hypothetical protein
MIEICLLPWKHQEDERSSVLLCKLAVEYLPEAAVVGQFPVILCHESIPA